MKKTIGTFTLIKNEAPFIAAHILNLISWVDEMVFFDGGSTDGTLEIIEAVKNDYDKGNKIKLFRDKDPKNLQDDYVRLSNECMWSLGTDLAFFCHPDMHMVNPERIIAVKESDAVALKVRMRSFAGEPGGQRYEIQEGRNDYWKNIYRLRGPDLGAHYFGHYGAHEEDVYYSDITGDQHHNHAPHFDRYPYEVVDSGLEVLHFSDVRTKARRIERMVRCTLNQGFKPLVAAERAVKHPRITFKDGDGFKFVPAAYPPEFLADNARYATHIKENTPANV